MKTNAVERFLSEFAGWYIAEWSPPSGCTIDEAAHQACAAIALGASVIRFRFNGTLLEVTRNDTPAGVANRFHAERAGSP